MSKLLNNRSSNNPSSITDNVHNYMLDKKSIILVIGNGFDLALGYDSGYTHFINTIGSVEHYFWPFKQPDDSKYNTESLYQYFYEYFKSHLDDSGRIKWIDLEGELYKYASSKRGMKVPEELVAYDKWNFDMLVRALYLYLNRHQELKYKYHPHKGEEKCVVELLKALSTSNNFKKAYTFNYTDLKERFIKYGGFVEDSIPSITYIHGSLENSTEDVPKIVLGINTDFSLPKEYSFLQKINNPYADAGDLAVDLITGDEIIFYGLSMGRIDFEYFQSFFQSILTAPITTPKKHISILTKGEDMVASIRQNIHDMGINIRALTERSHLKIINTHEAEFDNNGHNDAFHKLIERIRQ